jgi:hypothetical protein
VARLVGDLGGLEELGVLTLHVVDELAAQKHRAVLARNQGGQPPARDAAVQLDAVGLRHGVPEPRAVDVYKVVRNQPAVALERYRPVDVGGGVPLVDLGLLVEPAQVGLFTGVVVEKVRGVLCLDLVPFGHGVLHIVLMEEG